MRNTTTIQSVYHLISRHLFSVCLACLSVLLICTISHAAGINTDGSMGPATTLTGPNYTIPPDLGQQKGSNLFHSFGNFNVNTGESATFTGPDGTTNVIGRVTEGNQSMIDGLLTCKIPGANLWLLNPFGILFGSNASLDIKGSFHASTADYLQLSDGGVFYTDPSKTSKLTIAAPAAFGFLSSHPKEITINESKLTVKSGKTLSLIGGNINIINGQLIAPSGKINLVSLASPGEVVLNEDGIAVKGSPEFGDIQITDKALQGSFIDVSGLNDINTHAKSGSVDIHCSNLDLFQSKINAYSYGDLDDSGDIRIFAEKNMSISNSNITVESNGKGKGGNIQINADELRVENGSQLGICSNYSGNTGDINITANLVYIGETNTDGTQSGISSTITGSGNCGYFEIKTDKLKMENGGFLGLYTQYGSTGNGGELKITANTIELDGVARNSSETATAQSGIFTYTQGEGHGSNLNINTDQLTLSNGAIIQGGVLTGGTGDGGDITVHATDIKIDGAGLNPDGHVATYTAITSDAWPNPKGNAGSIYLDAKTVSLTNGAKIAANTRGIGNGGTIDIIAENILIDGGFIDKFGEPHISQVSAFTYSVGDAGKINLNAGNLLISHGGSVIASTTSKGNAGQINITADDVTIDGYLTDSTGNFVIVSGIESDNSSSGNAGQVTIQAKSLNVLNGALIQVANSGSKSGGSVMVEANSLNIDGGVYDKNEKFYWASKITASSWGQGDAGSINILADKLSVTDGGMIVALSNSSGTGGNIRIQSDSVVLNGAFSDPQNQYYPSAISSQTKATGQGGNIELITGSLEISEGAQIDTSSFGSGSAGKIAIDAQNIDLSGAFTNSKWLVPSSIASGSVQSGKGGNIDIHTSVLNIANGAAISVAGKTTGDGGDITIQADAISISGVAVNEILNASKSAGIYSNANDGNAGDITIKSTSLKIFDNGIIEAKTDGTGTGGNIIVDAKTIEMNSNAVISSASTGTGDAGSINLTVADKLEIRDSTITTESMLADGGDITITTTTTTGFLTWLIDSSITATVGGGSQTTGGNIRINSPYVVLKDSHVIANAYEGKGGNIGITADTYLADWTSTVSASSALGISGQVDINSPIVNLSGLLSPLPTALVDITELLVSDCETRYKRRKASSLVVKGRDALPAQPGDLWPSPVMMQ